MTRKFFQLESTKGVKRRLTALFGKKSNDIDELTVPHRYTYSTQIKLDKIKDKILNVLHQLNVDQKPKDLKNYLLGNTSFECLVTHQPFIDSFNKTLENLERKQYAEPYSSNEVEQLNKKINLLIERIQQDALNIIKNLVISLQHLSITLKDDIQNKIIRAQLANQVRAQTEKLIGLQTELKNSPRVLNQSEIKALERENKDIFKVGGFDKKILEYQARIEDALRQLSSEGKKNKRHRHSKIQEFTIQFNGKDRDISRDFEPLVRKYIQIYIKFKRYPDYKQAHTIERALNTYDNLMKAFCHFEQYMLQRTNNRFNFFNKEKNTAVILALKTLIKVSMYLLKQMVTDSIKFIYFPCNTSEIYAFLD